MSCALPRNLSIVSGTRLDEEPGLGSLTLPGFLREVTARHGDREALVLHTPDTVVRWTYARLWEEALKVARALRATGVGKDSRVGVLMTNRPEWLAAVFGVGLVGAVAVPLSTFCTAPELESLLDISAVSILLLERHIAGKDFAAYLWERESAVRAQEPGALLSNRFPLLSRIVILGETADRWGDGELDSWSEFLEHGLAISPAAIDAISAGVGPADTAALFFSSGSTSRPKGIFSRHRGIAIQLWRCCRILGLDKDVRCWTPNGFFWSGNFALALGATLAAGGTLVLQRVFDPAEALRLMEEEHVSIPHAWPHQWARMEAAPNWSSADLSSLRYVDIREHCGRHPSIVNPTWSQKPVGYGQTETFTMISALPSATPVASIDRTHGSPLPGNTIKIIEPDSGAVVPRGQVGEIAVKGPTLMIGYVGVLPEETFDEEGFFHTGDAGHIDDQGCLCWAGRISEIIKTGGANVSPVEIDAVLTHYPGLKASKTVGMPHDTLGEMIVTCICPHDDVVIDEIDVRGFLKKQIASYKVPQRVLQVREDQLSLTGSNKIKASALREWVAVRLATEQT